MNAQSTGVKSNDIINTIIATAIKSAVILAVVFFYLFAFLFHNLAISDLNWLPIVYVVLAPLLVSIIAATYKVNLRLNKWSILLCTALFVISIATALYLLYLTHSATNHPLQNLPWNAETVSLLIPCSFAANGLCWICCTWNANNHRRSLSAVGFINAGLILSILEFQKLLYSLELDIEAVALYRLNDTFFQAGKWTAIGIACAVVYWIIFAVIRSRKQTQ